MTAYLAGITQSRCAEHPKAGDIDGVMRAVLAAMAYPARDARSTCADDVRFLCSESVATIVSRCGYDRKVVMRAQSRLSDLQLIECVKAPYKQPKHWRLTALMSLRGTSEPETDLSPTGTTHVPERDKTCTSEGLNPSVSPGAQAEGEEEEAVASLPASAGAPAGATRPAGPSAETLAEIMKRASCSKKHAEQWAAAMLDGRSIKSPDRYLLGCEKRGDGPATWGPPRPRQSPSTTQSRRSSTTAPAKKTTAGKKPPKRTPAEKPAKRPSGIPSAKEVAARQAMHDRPFYTVRKHQEPDVLLAHRAGEAHQKLAERFNVTLAGIDDWCTRQDMAAAMNAARDGATVEQAAERFNVSVGALRTSRRSEIRYAIRQKRSHEDIAAFVGVSVDEVRAVHAELIDSEIRGGYRRTTPPLPPEPQPPATQPPPPADRPSWAPWSAKPAEPAPAQRRPFSDPAPAPRTNGHRQRPFGEPTDPKMPF